MGRPAAELGVETLRLDELEAIRLADLEGLYQEAAAERMGVSRATFARVLERARAAVARALINEKLLVIGEGPVVAVPGDPLPCPVHGFGRRRGARLLLPARGAPWTQRSSTALRTGEENTMVMTIAVPLMGGSFSDHFGGADAFALYSVDEARRTVDGRQVLVPPEHGHGVYPMWLRQLGATVVLAGGMGPRASGMSRSMASRSCSASRARPHAVVRSFLDGTLVATGEPCHDHSFHDCGHHAPREGGCGGHHQDDEEAAGSASPSRRSARATSKSTALGASRRSRPDTCRRWWERHWERPRRW